MAERLTELELDHLFWDRITTGKAFQRWFLSLTKFRGRKLDIVTDEKWHQRWCKCPETKRDFECDILLMLRDTANGERVSVHIENKPDHRTWTHPSQAEQYRKRAHNQKTKWRYVDFETALMAPASFVARWPAEVAHFDLLVPYEEVSRFIPEYSAI